MVVNEECTWTWCLTFTRSYLRLCRAIWQFWRPLKPYCSCVPLAWTTVLFNRGTAILCRSANRYPDGLLGSACVKTFGAHSQRKLVCGTSQQLPQTAGRMTHNPFSCDCVIEVFWGIPAIAAGDFFTTCRLSPDPSRTCRYRSVYSVCCNLQFNAIPCIFHALPTTISHTHLWAIYRR